MAPRTIRGHVRLILRSSAAALGLVVGLDAAAAQEVAPLPQPEGPVVLTVTGSIGRTNDRNAARFDRAMLEALPHTTLETHTVVTDGLKSFEGFLMRDLLARVDANGDTVTASALNDYVIDIPMSDFERYDVLVASSMDGERLLARNKGPYWIVYPRDDHAELQDIRFDYRWVWQLERLEVK